MSPATGDEPKDVTVSVPRTLTQRVTSAIAVSRSTPHSPSTARAA